MKIGILTFTNGTNLGQRLQNFALQQVIKEIVLGCTVMTIKQSYPFNTVKRNIRMCITFLFHPKRELLRLRRKRCFDRFNKKHIQFYPKEISFQGDNTWVAKEFDCFVAGSDQIWNPNSPFVGPNFFLTFAQPLQRLTYAPSFSVDEMPVDKVGLYKKYLGGFNTISVRENRGAEIVNELTGKHAEVVLDPTLLLGKQEYDKIKVEYKNRPIKRYILAMFLGDVPQNDIEKISKGQDLEVFYLTPDTEIGPDEFIDVVEHAELVLTDSYHVTIFSIIYHRPFVNFVRSGKGETMSSRFETLYRILGIHDRTWNYLKNHIDEITYMEFDEIDCSIKKEQSRCRSILKRELFFAFKDACDMQYGS